MAAQPALLSPGGNRLLASSAIAGARSYRFSRYPSTILSWSLAGFVAFILCFISIAQYARKETVTGYLNPTSGTAKIFVPQQGFIKEIKVKEGRRLRRVSRS